MAEAFDYCTQIYVLSIISHCTELDEEKKAREILKEVDKFNKVIIS